MFRGRSSSKKKARIICSLREEFRPKDLLLYTKMPKATYMYWQKRLDRVNPDKQIEEIIIEIRENNKDYGYRRVCGALRNLRHTINKKKVQRIIQKLGLQVTSFTRKSRKYNSYKGNIGKTAKNRIRRRFNTTIPYQKITTDTTEFKYYEVNEKGKVIVKKLYSDPFMDMYNGEIINYSISECPTVKNIMDALEEVIKVTASSPFRRTFHSD